MPSTEDRYVVGCHPIDPWSLKTSVRHRVDFILQYINQMRPT